MQRRIALTLVSAVASAAVAQPSVAQPGTGFDVERYAVAVRPDLATTAVSGTQTIVVRATSERVDTLSFSPNALTISEATANGVPIAVLSGTDGIAFKLPVALRKGARATLRFRTSGTPARGVTPVTGGLYASYFACDWMVCLQDSPGDKAHLTLDLLLPAGVASVGVGRAEPTSTLPDGLVLHRWQSARPYSPYLYGFAAGPFPRQSFKTAKGEFAFLNATGSDADIGKLFAQTSAMAQFFAEKAGIALPDRQYVQVLVPGSAAQETASFSLIGKAELDAERDDPSSGWAVAHEFAHQWWGNLVTCATWQDFWLNEGIATFMVAAWKQQSAGEAAYRHELAIALGKVKRARDLGYDKPLAWPGKYPSLGVRRAVQYSKGAVFLAHLRDTIGDTAFWAGLRLFTQNHAGRTVTSRDFQAAMQKASGRDLSPMFTEWVYGEARSPS